MPVAIHVKESKDRPYRRRTNPHGCGSVGGVDYGRGALPVSHFLARRTGQAAATETWGSVKVLRWPDGLYTDQLGRPIVRNADERKRWAEASGQQYEGD